MFYKLNAIKMTKLNSMLPVYDNFREQTLPNTVRLYSYIVDVLHYR